jgi:hypothetical protein
MEALGAFWFGSERDARGFILGSPRTGSKRAAGPRFDCMVPIGPLKLPIPSDLTLVFVWFILTSVDHSSSSLRRRAR